MDRSPPNILTNNPPWPKGAEKILITLPLCADQYIIYEMVVRLPSLYNILSTRMQPDFPMVTPDLIYMLIEQEAHLSRRETCKGDDYHGSCVSYYDTGQLKSLEFYREGDLHGTARYFDRRGAVKVEHTYLEGKIYEHQLLENFSKKAHRNQDNIPPMQAKAYQNPARPPQAFTEENMQVDFLYKAPRTGNIVRLSHHSAGEVTFEEVDALLGKIHMQPYFSFPEC